MIKLLNEVLFQKDVVVPRYIDSSKISYIEPFFEKNGEKYGQLSRITMKSGEVIIVEGNALRLRSELGMDKIILHD